MSKSDAAVYARWKAKLKAREALLDHARRQAAYWSAQYHRAKPGTARRALAYRMTKSRKAKVAKREAQVAEARKVVARHTPTLLREKAYKAAVSQLGVMETGGNNSGVPLTRYIKTNQGTGPEPWCGDFVAWCYRQAGSKRVSRAWAAVRLLSGVLGVKRTSKPQRGDLVRFTFSHVGIFVRDLGDGTIETIEGNTGASGAVSDSSTGGDGVYRKLRSKGLVQDYLRVVG
jgi:hypothetical protein